MATYFISPFQREKIETSISAIFSEFLERLDGDDQLYILGDLFESWIGDDNVSELGTFVVNQLKLLSKKGIQVSIMHGNRDFLIGNDFCDAASIQLINDPCIIDINDEKAMLTHGDQLCTDDHEYQAFRSVVRNPIWQKDFLNFPISKREKIAGETKNASKDSKVKKTMEIMDVNDEAVLKAFDDNEIGIMIHGHTHRPNVHKISNDNRIFTRYVLGDWSKESAIILKWDEAGIELLDLADSH
jgi:UDP-2,3-diacylglucosamine hydrolase